MDDDVDLYGETETAEKKARGNTSNAAPNPNNVEFATHTEAASNSNAFEWLMFLVGQDGDLQVLHPLNTTLTFRYDD
jgi:hypothetical protein